MLKRLQAEPGTFAVAALPCHIHGIRKAMAEEPWIKQKIRVLIGLFCGGALKPEVVTDMLRTKGLRKEDISDFQFRGGEWPGKIRAIKKDGTICNMHYSNYKDGAYNYFVGLYMPMRCQTCIDGSNEFSDFSVSDAWTKNRYGEYTFKSCSKVLIRTDRGAKTIKEAASRGSIRLIDINRDENYKTQKLQAKRKGITAPLRVQRLGGKGVDVPLYDKAVPDATLKEKLMERGVSFLLANAERLHLRYYIIKFLTSRFAIPLIDFRLWLKNKKYQKRR
jgi:coenzyme F420 hydrogenase subunit beta